MCGMTLLDKIDNCVSRKWTGVEDINKHLRGRRLRWLGHLERMNMKSLRRKVREKTIMKYVKRGRPKETWDTVKDDMKR